MDTLEESLQALSTIGDYLQEKQASTGVKLLWSTQNLFSHPRYMNGAMTSPTVDIFCYAAAQIQAVMDLNHKLGGTNHVFWGGREGYQSLLNTDVRKECDHMAAMLQMAVDYKSRQGYTAQFLLEPKPREPTKHQYDSDVAACLNFLREYDLMDHFKLNVETNHATLAGHTMHHELEVASAAGALGSIDANTGDPMLGWDTDQFPTDIYLTTQCMLAILDQGGLAPGGVNFDAKVRRESFEPIDLFYAHIGGMDAFARGARIASQIRKDGILSDFVSKRYASYDEGIGAQIEAGSVNFSDLEAYMLEKGDSAPNSSGRQEWIENVINDYI